MHTASKEHGSPGEPLQERLAAEARFHEHKYQSEHSMPRHYRVQPTYPVFREMLSRLGEDLKGRRVLEYGCGTGWATVELLTRSANVWSFDISSEAVAQTAKAAQRLGARGTCDVRVMAGERLDYLDDTFDFAVGFAILHHLDLATALPELRRVLKPGGIAIFGEPLDGNPLINAYRRLTPRYHSADERPIDLRALAEQATAFKRYEHHERLILATAVAVLGYVPFIWRAAGHSQRALMATDRWLLKALPGVGRLAWYSILVLEK